MEATKKYSIEDVKKAIAGKAKPQQLNIITQEKNNYGLEQVSIHKRDSPNKYEEGFADQIDELFKEIENDQSYKYECDWNWFFNADNIPNQELVFATKDFLEFKRKDVDSLLMLNILFRQMDNLKSYLDKPVDFIEHLKFLPLDDTQRHILFGLVLRWHGGYPVNNLNPKYDTILKLIEREFLAMFPNVLTAEKEFCAVDIKDQKILREAEAHINAELKRKFTFTESKYIDHISIDFEDLPQYIIQRGIIWRFEGERLHKDADYIEWRDKLLELLQTVPKIYVIKTLQKSIEYGKKVYEYHLYNECTNPGGCSLNQSWERRLAIAEDILEDVIGKETPKEDIHQKEESAQRDYAKYKIPVLPLSDPERLWIQEVYLRTKKGTKFSFKEIRGKLHNQLPVDFRPATMDGRLISSNGEEIRLLGIIALERNFISLEKINRTILAIRDIILKDHEKRNIEIAEIAERCSLPLEEIGLALRLVRDYGTFYTGSSYDADNTRLKSIDVGGSDAVYYEYIQFPGIEQLIVLKSYQFYEQPGEEFTIDEMMEMSQKLDAVLQELQTLKTGQEIIWTDVLNELNELKAHYSLNKKNWKQLFAGKIIDMVASGVISETVSKRIVEVFNPIVGKLLN